MGYVRDLKTKRNGQVLMSTLWKPGFGEATFLKAALEFGMSLIISVISYHPHCNLANVLELNFESWLRRDPIFLALYKNEH